MGGLLCGAATCYSLTAYFNPQTKQNLDHKEFQMVDAYISNHKL